ncbi:methylmalonyl Co-A mutase-associated GTPase MeaB [bacterium]|nr:methylmalonyl Co-A mutase-associated GTPase MeaB [bacterium]
MNESWENLVIGVANRNIRSLARLITRVENREPGWKDAMKTIFPKTGAARIIGITGSPGAGKSTLTAEIAQELVNKGRTVGIIAVDPSSPFSGGAILGDRLRMRQLFTLEDVFIRSMATRGVLGGLCYAARDIVRILDAFGKEFILIETVGVGQDEVDIVKTADQVMVVCIPGQGDGIQAIKAGIMEIADIFVVNKADKPGSDEVVADITAMLELSTETGQRIPQVLKTSALKKEGVKELVATLLGLQVDEKRKKQKEETRAKAELMTLLEEEIFQYARKLWDGNKQINTIVKDILEKRDDPYSAVHGLLPFSIADKN